MNDQTLSLFTPEYSIHPTTFEREIPVYNCKRRTELPWNMVILISSTSTTTEFGVTTTSPTLIMKDTAGYVPLQAVTAEEAGQVPFISTVRLRPDPPSTFGTSTGKRSRNLLQLQPFFPIFLKFWTLLSILSSPGLFDFFKSVLEVHFFPLQLIFEVGNIED